MDTNTSLFGALIGRVLAWTTESGLAGKLTNAAKEGAGFIASAKSAPELVERVNDKAGKILRFYSKHIADHTLGQRGKKDVTLWTRFKFWAIKNYIALKVEDAAAPILRDKYARQANEQENMARAAVRDGINRYWGFDVHATSTSSKLTKRSDQPAAVAAPSTDKTNTRVSTNTAVRRSLGRGSLKPTTIQRKPKTSSEQLQNAAARRATRIANYKARRGRK